MTGLSRRGFLRGLAGASLVGAGGCCTGPRCIGWGEKVRLAAVGIWGRGFGDWMPMLKSGQAELVALCDCDRDAIARVAASPDFKGLGIDVNRVRFFDDYRRLLDEAGILGIDAMTVSTADHAHAPIAVRAMQQGIHCYVQTPLVRTLWELDYFAKTARDYGVVTQMGDQASAAEGFRGAVAVLGSGVLGDVREVHAWSGGRAWLQGVAAAAALRSPVAKPPRNLNWEAWLATAKGRPYRKGMGDNCHPRGWRGYFDFGSGSFGDVACNALDLPFRGLELGAVAAAECLVSEDLSDIAYPSKSVVRLFYGARDSRLRPGTRLPEVVLNWYEGGFKPDAGAVSALAAACGGLPESGCAVVGSEGTLFAADGFGRRCLVAFGGEKTAQDVRGHEATRNLSTAATRGDPDRAHCVEFLDAVLGRGPVLAETGSRCSSDVGFSVPMTESLLVGAIAQRVHGRIGWNSDKQVFDNKNANALMRPYIRKGYEF